jgi:hypothetical protein
LTYEDLGQNKKQERSGYGFFYDTADGHGHRVADNNFINLNTEVYYTTGKQISTRACWCFCFL